MANDNDETYKEWFEREDRKKREEIERYNEKTKEYMVNTAIIGGVITVFFTLMAATAGALSAFLSFLVIGSFSVVFVVYVWAERNSRKPATFGQLMNYVHQINNTTFTVCKCPTCGSQNTSSISTGNRLASTAMWGMASGKIGKTKKCNDCNYMW